MTPPCPVHPKKGSIPMSKYGANHLYVLLIRTVEECPKDERALLSNSRDILQAISFDHGRARHHIENHQYATACNKPGKIF
jgi:hypothetical protein